MKMKVEGKWKLVRSENSTAYLKQAGLNDEAIAKLQAANEGSTMTLKDSGTSMDVELVTKGGSTNFNLTYGQECEIKIPNGTVHKGVAKKNGEKIEGQFGKGFNTIEIGADGNLKHTITAGEITFVRHFERA